MAWFILLLYALLLLFIFCYSLIQAHLVWIYWTQKKLTSKTKIPDWKPLYQQYIAEKSDKSEIIEQFPFITIQLPIYNEKYVVERLIDACIQINYPLEKLEIQVLDDSTDETTQIIQDKLASLTSSHFPIHHIHRTNRQGFKAGALAEGLQKAEGAFVAIFDADFLPHPDFLLITVPFFENATIGMVQTPWQHLNEDYSILTKLQAFGLDAHFLVEQNGRYWGAYCLNFNGTAGIWRKSCIEDAGGWHSDTLTEDLDLSYRAQLKGWKFVFTEQIGSPAELPVTINAIKNQQYRWTKGAAECAKKNICKVIASPDFSWKRKIHAFFHLSNSFIFVSILGAVLLSVPFLHFKAHLTELAFFFQWASLFLVGFMILISFYWLPSRRKFQTNGETFFYFIKTFPLFLAVSMGLSLYNAIAVLEGYAGKKTSFVRTPKFNILRVQDTWQSRQYAQFKLSWLTWAEIALAFYAMYGLYLGIILKDYGLIPFHLFAALGFGFVGFWAVGEKWRGFRNVHNKMMSQ